MSSVSGIKAGRAYVAIGGDDSELRAVLKRAEKSLNSTAKAIQSIGKQMIVAGGAIGGGLLAAAVSAGKLGDHLNDLNAKTGVGVNALAGLDIAASTSGSSLDALAGDIYKMNRVVGEAAGGSKSAADALAELGLTIADLQGLSPDKQFGLFADRIAAIPDPAGRAAAATKIFGRASGDLMPILMQGSRGLKEFQAQADSLGITLAYKTATGVGEFDDALARTRKQIEAVKVTIGAAIASALLPYQDSIGQALAKTIQWAAQNGDLIVQVGEVAAKVTAGGAALIGMSAALNVTAKTIGTVSVALKLLNANPIIAVATVVATVAAALILNEKLIAAQNMKVMISLNEYTKANDEARASDLERINYLKVLAATGKLNDVQMNDARQMIAQLESHYGSLGITIDKTAGQIIGMAGAWDKVTAAMGEAAKADIQKQLQSVDEEFSRLEKDFKSINDDWWDGLARLDSASGNIELGTTDVSQQSQKKQSKKPPKIVQDNIDAQNTLLEKRRELNRRLKEIDDRTTNALTGGASPAPKLDTSGIVTSIENVGDAAIESGNKVNRWAESLRMAQEMMRKQKAGEDFLLDLTTAHARAKGNDVFADGLDVVREYQAALNELKSFNLSDVQKQWAKSTALDTAEAQLERIRKGLNQNQISGFSAGTFGADSTSIASLNRTSGGKDGFSKLVSSNEKQNQTLEQVKEILRRIELKEGGLIFGP